MDCCAPGSAEPVSLVLLFTTGLLMSLGHCIGMCGPIVTAFAVNQAEAGAPRWRLAWPLAVFQAGRVASYAAIGVVMGLIGAAASLAGGPRTLMGTLSMVAGVAMLVAGASLLGWLPLQGWLEAAPLGRAVSRAIGSLLRARRTSSRFLLGVANGFLPCGPVAAAAISAAAAGSAGRGALAMAAYGAGTVPALIVLGLGAGLLDARLRLRLFRAGAVVVLVIGAQLVLRGLHAYGVIPVMRVGPLVLW